ncbi:MAG: aconitate hydratase [Lentisphaerae bacterium]|nr:aconitate hydratase [Lentisphaerota bacterium]
MGLNVTGKILEAHLVEGKLSAGEEIGIRIDQTLTQDATGTMAFLQFEAMGVDRVLNELAVSYVDHNTLQAGSENADDHAYLQSAAARYGAVFSRPGNGICHQVHLERFGAPGKTLLGADSHTPMAGGIGMLGMGAGGLDVAVAMGGGLFRLAAPKVIRIQLKGKLGEWVTAKDVILKVLETFSTKGNVGCVFEYAGPGLRNLDVPQRATITNMGAECGVTSSVFPSDEMTKRFLESQGRGDAWGELQADEDAAYYKDVTIDLSNIEPLAAAPHSPGNVVTVASLAGIPVQQVAIGSCTNSSYRDIKTVAGILEGRTVNPNLSLGIAPGSRQVLQMIARDGTLSSLVASGARILETACGFCIGNSFAPATNAVSLRTSNRNFEGRSGTASARVYLVSPAIAAASALAGRVVDPRLTEEPAWPRVRVPKDFDVDDSMIVFPPGPKEGGAVDVVRGSSIGELPVNEPLPGELSGVVAIKVGDKITTDHIMPAGPRLKFRSNIAKYASFVFEGVDGEFVSRALGNRDGGMHNVIVAGESYGQGSSREHAAMCPRFLGVRAVVAKSIERIHLANLVNFGIVPLVFAREQDYGDLAEGDKVSVAGIRDAVVGEGKVVLRNETKRTEILLKAVVTEKQVDILLAGGLLNTVSGK